MTVMWLDSWLLTAVAVLAFWAVVVTGLTVLFCVASETDRDPGMASEIKTAPDELGERKWR